MGPNNIKLHFRYNCFGDIVIPCEAGESTGRMKLHLPTLFKVNKKSLKPVGTYTPLIEYIHNIATPEQMQWITQWVIEYRPTWFDKWLKATKSTRRKPQVDRWLR